MKEPNDNIRDTVLKSLGIDEYTFRTHRKELKDIDGWYFWNPLRGGSAIIINSNGENLVEYSGVSFTRHYQEFLEGRRN